MINIDLGKNTCLKELWLLGSSTWKHIAVNKQIMNIKKIY